MLVKFKKLIKFKIIMKIFFKNYKTKMIVMMQQMIKAIKKSLKMMTLDLIKIIIIKMMIMMNAIKIMKRMRMKTRIKLMNWKNLMISMLMKKFNKMKIN